MSIKIPSGPPQGDAIEAAKDAGATQGVDKTAETGTAAPIEQDAVSKIAEQVAKGEITREQALESLMAEVLDSDIVKAAPAELKEEIKEILETMLDTSPYLRSLSSALGPSDTD